MIVVVIVVVTVTRIVTGMVRWRLGLGLRLGKMVVVVEAWLNHIELHVSWADPSVVVVGCMDRRGRHLQVWR